MLTNIDLEKMNHLMETNKDAKEIITQLLKNHDAAVATIAHEIRNPWMAPDICVICWMI